jgi:hypothetical protein
MLGILSVTAAIQRSGCRQVLDLASGLALRGLADHYNLSFPAVNAIEMSQLREVVRNLLLDEPRAVVKVGRKRCALGAYAPNAHLFRHLYKGRLSNSYLYLQSQRLGRIETVGPDSQVQGLRVLLQPISQA